MNPTNELYGSLEEAYDFFNLKLFSGQLPTVIFTVQRQKGVMGYFAANRWGNLRGNRCHEIAINPSYIANSCLIEVVQTLVHEMVHCWQFSFGKPSRGHYHNLEWSKKMIKIGLMPSSTGLPGGSITGQSMSDFVIKDGLFAQNYEQLKVNNDFQLKWIDRIAATKVFDTAFYSPVVEVEEESVVKLSQGFNEQNEVRNSTTIHPSLQIKNEQTFVEQAPEELFITAPARSKNSKTKYRCSSCLNNVWGKPELNIICGDCKIPFIKV
tara:strand:+ start:3630 stop:4430 length:801 start_codon:yes stop_codon:yes gene_type:complete